MTAGARDMTEESRRRSALVLAPHPDDETLGCGGTILLKRSVDTAVTVCIATDGRGSGRPGDESPDAIVVRRASETREACRRLGVDDDHVRFLGYRDGELRRDHEELVDVLRGLVDELAPDDVFVPIAIDWHDDHKVLSAAARAAVHDLDDGPRVLAYPVWFWSRRTWIGPVPDETPAQTLMAQLRVLSGLSLRSVDVRGQVQAKRVALAAYADELGQFGDRFLERFVVPRELFFADRGGRHPVAG